MATTSILSIKGNPPTASGNRLSQLLKWIDDCISYRLTDPAVQAARTTTYFFDNTNGNDGTKDGRDGLGLNLSSATYTASTRTLTKTGGFTSYTWAKNDLIYLSSGVTAGLYKIESKTDNNNVVLAAAADTYEGTRAAPTSDATGIASSTGPWKTISKAYTTLTASTGSRDMRIRLKRGETWLEGAAFTSVSSCNNWTIDTYGSGAKPMVSYFVDSITSGAWTNVSGNMYSHAAPGTVTASNIAWIREQQNIFRAYMRIDQQGSDTANKNFVAANSWTWCIDASNVIYINMGGLNPNTCYAGGQAGFEVNKLSTTTPGILVNQCDGWLIKDIQFHGWNQNFTAQAYGVLLGAENYNQGVCDGVESFYSGYHPIGTTANGSSGSGVITIVNCRAGYATPWTGETMINIFSPGAGAEHIVDNCEVPFGSLPSDRWASTYATAQKGRGTAYYGHTVTGAHALQIVRNCTSGLGNADFGSPDTIALSNLPTATARSDARGFIVNFRCVGRQYNTRATIAPPGAVMINSQFDVRGHFKSQEGATDTYESGWSINNQFTYDCSLQTNSGGTTTYQQASSFFTAGATPKVEFSRLEMVNTWNRIGFGPPDFTAVDGYMWKSIITSTSFGGNCTMNITNNDSTHLNSNAYCGRWSYSTLSGDPAPLLLNTLVGNPHRGWAGEGSVTQVCYDGFVVDVDAIGNLRAVMTCPGAIETVPSSNVKLFPRVRGRL